MATWSTRAAVRECQLSAHGDLTVTERLATLLDTGQFADVTIRVGQGTDYATFKAHRLLLATASQPLYRLVSTVQQGHADFNTFRITDVEPKAFKNVLKFIYTDEVSIESVLEAFALLKAGKKWNLKKMNNKTIKYIEGFLDDYSPDTEEKKNEIFDFLVLSEAHSSELFEKCLSIAIKHAEDIIPSQGFLRLDDKTIRRLIGDPRFTYSNQLGLFEAIRDWGMNQILLRGLNPTQLHPIIEDLLSHVDFELIKDKDFMGTVFSSDCLGRAEIISFFMTRGLEVPRDSAFGKEGEKALQNGVVNDYKRARRFKKGFKLPHKEIYQEHEVRFRVDKNIKLLGVGFGFLFSNTDMGVTVHCQGPWERVQWTDMTQTYCRISWEKMHSANLHLMFNEAARLEANHCYKILVRVTRMTAGSTDVELWGGKDGLLSVEAEDAKFHFIKAAVDPKKDVDTKDLDTKQGMITELLYVIDDSPPPRVEEITARRRRPVVEPEDIYKPKEEVAKPFTRRRPVVTDDETPSEVTSLARRREVGGTYNRWQPSSLSTATESRTSRWAPKERSPETIEKSKTPEVVDNTPSYLRKRSPPALKETPSYLRTRASTTTNPESPFGDRLSRPATRSWARVRPPAETTGTSSTTSRYGTDSTTSSTTSRYGTDSTTPSTTSRYGTDSTTPSTTSRYGTDSTTPSTTSRYGTDSTTPSSTSRFGTDSSTSTSSRFGRDSALSSRYGTSTIGRDSSASRDTSSRYSRESPATSSYTSRFGRESSAAKETSSTSATSRYGRESSAAKDTTSTSGDTGSSLYRRPSTTSSSTLPSYMKKDTTTSDTSPSGSSLYRSNSSRVSRDLATSRFGSRFGRDSSGSRYGTSYGSSYGTGTSSYGSSYGSGKYSSGYVSRFR